MPALTFIYTPHELLEFPFLSRRRRSQPFLSLGVWQWYSPTELFVDCEAVWCVGECVLL